jgi:hypothetical protein
VIEQQTAGSSADEIRAHGESELSEEAIPPRARTRSRSATMPGRPRGTGTRPNGNCASEPAKRTSKAKGRAPANASAHGCDPAGLFETGGNVLGVLRGEQSAFLTVGDGPVGFATQRSSAPL